MRSDIARQATRIDSDDGRRVTVRVEFIKGPSTRYRSILHRPDGLVVELDGGSYNKVGGHPDSVPHDFAHFVVEHELGLTGGVWGVLVAGGLFRHAKVISGRQAPHAARRSRAIIDAAGDRIMQAELRTRVVCDAARGDLTSAPEALRRAAGEKWPPDALTVGAFDRCRTRLRAAAVDWGELAPGGSLVERWELPVDRALTARRPVSARRGR